MSTRFAARKVVSSEEQVERVNWLYAADLGTFGVSISEKSGLVKIDLGLGRRNPALYRNEIIALLDKAEELKRYLDDHPDAKNTPPSARERKSLEALADTIDAAKNKTLNDMVKAMRDAGMSEDLITQAISKVK